MIAACDASAEPHAAAPVMELDADPDGTSRLADLGGAALESPARLGGARAGRNRIDQIEGPSAPAKRGG